LPITRKDTQYGFETWFLVRKRLLLPLLPKDLSPYTRLGFGMIAIGIWKHSNVYIDDKSYGPLLEAWVGIGLKHNGKLYGLVHTTYDSNLSYIEPVNRLFKFSKVLADMQWKENRRRHQLEVWANNKLVIRFVGSPTFIPALIPYSKPRPGWLIKDSDCFTMTMRISENKSRLAFTSIEIPDDSPMAYIVKALKPTVKYSVFYQDATIEMPTPDKVLLDSG